MNDCTPYRNQRGPLFLVAFLCLIIVYFTWYPGVSTMDELDIFTQSRHGPVHDGHSPLLVALWRLTNMIKLGPALPYLLALTLAIFGCAKLCLSLSPRPMAASLMLCSIISIPPIFTSLGLVTKDIFLVASMLSVFNALGRWTRKPSRANLGFLLFCVQLAVFIRLDAVFALFPLLVYLAWSILKTYHNDRTLTKLFSIFIAASIVFICISLVRLSNQYIFRTTSYHAEQVSMLFDLSAISVQTDRMLIPSSRLVGDFDVPELRARFNPSMADNLIWSADSRHLIYQPSANQAELHKAWWNAISTNPLAYLRFRAEYAARFIGLRNNVAHMRAQFFADESMTLHPENGWRKTNSPLQQAYLYISETAVGKYIFMPWVWLIASLLPLIGFASGFLGRDEQGFARTVPQLLVLSGISYTALMSCISAASLSRYHSWPRMAIGIAIVASIFQIVGRMKSFRRTSLVVMADR